MIRSFRDKRSAAIFAGLRIKAFHPNLQERAREKMKLLDQARTIADSGIATGKRLRPVHPGKILKKHFMQPRGLTPYALNKANGVAPIRMTQILHGERGVTADAALLLARFFATSADLWMGLQSQYDLEIAGKAGTIRSRLAKIAPYAEAHV